ncbi:MAG TPA: hypothetical protein DCP62_11250 [Erysipelotrichaceae bacterium]|nr:hypothetical protein [Erysipelotrichaceae bacterium]HAM64179.1 hypothetical protein [Erysipelotrichaceae bacterium]HAO61608.1 hypothetical protein [Erysipelotrichaceae bacterium]
MLALTAVSGHSAYYFLKELEKAGYAGKIRGIKRTTSKISHLSDLKLDIEYVDAEYDNHDSMIKALNGVDTLLHIAPNTLSHKVCDAAIDAGVDWMISIQTTGKFSKFKSAAELYLKVDDELLSKKDRIKLTVLYPTMIYGSMMDKNISKLIGFIDTHRVFPVFGKGHNLMRPVAGSDLAKAYFQILNQPEVTQNKEYVLSGAEPSRYIDILKEVAKNLNKRVWFVMIPLNLSIFLAKIYNLIFRKALISVEQVQRMQEDKAYDHDDATRDFGYDPMTFEEGIKIQVEEYLRKKKETK